MDKAFSALDDPERFEKIIDGEYVAYRPKNYKGPIARDAKIAKEDEVRETIKWMNEEE